MENKETKNRILWIDGIRALAALWIFYTHYEADCGFNSEIVNAIFYGISGKFMVAVLCVLLGYFASKELTKSKTVAQKILNRYLQFAIPLLFITTLQVLINFLVNGIPINIDVIKQIGYESLLFRTGDLCSQAWCISDFFIATILIYITSNKKHSLVIYTAWFVLLCVLGKVWIAICFLGAFVRLFSVWFDKNRDKIFKNKRRMILQIIKIVMLCVSLLIIRFPECNKTFLLGGISASMILIVCLNSVILQKILSFGILPIIRFFFI